MRFRKKRALSSVYGFIVVYTLIVAGLGAYSAVMDANEALDSSRQRADQIESMRPLEHLTITLGPDYASVLNDGLIPSNLAYLHTISASTSTDVRLGDKLSVDSSLSLPIPSSAYRVAVVTGLGNVFWAGTNLQAGNYSVIFDVNGLPPSFSGSTPLTVDGSAFSFSQLPKTFSWLPNSVHSYSYVQGFPSLGGTRIGWADTRGLRSTRTGQFAASQSGLVLADYGTQYLLTTSGGSNVAFAPQSPTGDGYFNQGSSVRVSTDYTWGVTPMQSRQNLVSYRLDGSTSTPAPRSGSGQFSTVVTMNSPHTLQLIPLTQYNLQLTTSVPSSGTAPPLGAGYSSYQPFTVSQALANPGFETGTTLGWSANSGNCGSGVLFGVETDPNNYGFVHSGDFSAYLLATSGPGCVYQTFTLPANSVLTSVSASAWVSLAGLSPEVPVINVEVKAGNNLNSPSCDLASKQFDPLYNWYRYSVSGTSCSGTQLQFDIGFPATASSYIYFDDASFSYSYNLVSSGKLQSTSSTYSVSGTTVSYSYGLSYAFPSGVLGRQLLFTLPPDESLTSLSSQTCGGVPSSYYTVSGKTVTIPDSTISNCGATWSVGATATGSYAVSQSGSQTGDDWYDAGSAAGIAATFNTPFVFDSWSGAPTIFSTNSAATSLTMNSHYAVNSKFDVSA